MEKICLVRWDMSVSGGAEKMTALLANEFAQKNEIIIISVFKENDLWAYRISDNVKIYTLALRHISLRYQIMIILTRLAIILLKEQIKTAIVIDSTTFFMCPMFKLFNINVVSSEHSNLKNKDRQNIKYKLLRYIAVRCSDMMITLTKEDMNEYISRYKINENKITYIYNFIDDLVDVVQYDTESKIIITVGRFDRIKGYDMLLDIAKIVFNKNKDWKWYIYGTGDRKYFKEISEKIKQYRIDENLILKGHYNNVDNMYKKASFLAMTSYNEGLPMVLLEAKKYKLPIISFSCPTGPIEIIEDGVSGFLVECYDIEEFARKILYLIDNDEVRKNFSKNANNNMQLFNKDRIIKKWYDIINKLEGDKSDS